MGTASNERLESWKEIADYLKRDVRTVQRWEKEERLPIRRHLHKKQATIYALRSELDSWIEKRRPRRRGWWKLAAIGMVLAGGVYGGWRLRAQAPSRIMLAVLPLENLSGDPDEAYFGDGLTDELITRLGGLSPERLGVIAWSSVKPYKTTTESVARIGDDLRVDYVLEGSFRREDGRVRVNAQLIRVRDQTHLWAESYERSLTGVLAVQADMARAIARSIELTLSPEKEAELSRVREVDPEAYESYLRGLVSFSELFTSSLEVPSHFERAIERDPDFALAHGWRGLSYAVLAFTGGYSREESVSRARAAAERALEIDPSQSEAHVVLGLIPFFIEWDWTRGLREIETVIELNGGSPWPYWANAWQLTALLRHDEAIEAMKRARSFDPVNPYLNTCVGEMFWFARRYDEAAQEWANVEARHPHYSRTYLLYRLMYQGIGEYEKAIEAYQRNREIRGDGLDRPDSLRMAYRDHGAEGYWRWWLAFTQEFDTRPLSLANLHGHLGEKDRAFDSLEQAFQERNPRLAFLRGPGFDDLHGDSRFHELVRRMNFPDP